MRDERHIKVLVPMGPSFEPEMPESMWAAPLDEPEHYEIRNTPWDAYGLSWGDRVRVDAPARPPGSSPRGPAFSTIANRPLEPFLI